MDAIPPWGAVELSPELRKLFHEKRVADRRNAERKVEEERRDTRRRDEDEFNHAILVPLFRLFKKLANDLEEDSYLVLEPGKGFDRAFQEKLKRTFAKRYNADPAQCVLLLASTIECVAKNKMFINQRFTLECKGDSIVLRRVGPPVYD